MTIDFWAYGMGHFLNDMTATCWFNYLLFFLTEVVQTGSGPYAILAGQLADGIATPIVGALSDRTRTKIGSDRLIQDKESHGTLVDAFWSFVHSFPPFRISATIP